jgi:hypothetical protein
MSADQMIELLGGGASHKSISIADKSTPSGYYAGVECEGPAIELSAFEPSRIVNSTAAADSENVGHIQDCGTSSG